MSRRLWREAFSPIKNQRLGLSFPESLEAHRAAFIDAKTDEELFWALVRLSNARHDRDLKATAARGGIKVPKSYNQFDPDDYPVIDIDYEVPPVASIRFLPDFSADPITFFVADRETDPSVIEGGGQIEIGDIVVSVNGSFFAKYLEQIAP